MLFDDRPCRLGEGPLWHPERGQLFWFDILEKRLLTRDASGPRHWQFDHHVSAAGRIDYDRLLIASEVALSTFDIRSGAQDVVVPLEAENPVTRSNDGRADPWGGFWIGTMGKAAEPDAGAIWRYWRGELRQLFAPITISNAICFAPDRRHGYFADTARRTIWRTALDGRDGWPAGEPEVFIDLNAQGLNPDGAVCDAEGNLWIAEWGAGRVACHAPDGHFLRALTVGGRHASCPAFGGTDLMNLYVTTASDGLPDDVRRAEPENGCTFVLGPDARGLPEHAVEL